MHIDAWWFENTQQAEKILQPEWFTPKTHCGVCLEFEKLKFPFRFSVQAFCNAQMMFSRSFEICNAKDVSAYDIFIKNDAVLIKLFAENASGLAEIICVTVETEHKTYKKQVKCKYSTIRGRITDFNGAPFPAAVAFERRAFGGKAPYIGAWSDKAGNYCVTVPNGDYGAFYVADNSYKTKTLENWSWNMCVDRDETHDFKIGTGEVYGLYARENADLGDILFLYFRPMILPQIRMQKRTIRLNNEPREVIDVQPDLEKDDIQIYLDGQKLKIYSLQRIYETGIYNDGEYIVIAYIVQAGKPILNRGKHTVIVEYNTAGNYKAQGQGRTQFFVRSVV